METIFDTTVTACGREASDLLDQGMLIIFGESVPDMLRDVVYVHRDATLSRDVRVGDVLTIDGDSWTVSLVGDVASQNLRALGHCTLAFGPETSASTLPGSIQLAEPLLPNPRVGSRITISGPGTTNP